MFPKSLPIEIWEEVVYGVDSGCDILSLALVSRNLSSIILPYHLPYYHIRCDIRRQYVWEYLIANPRCARGVRFLELINENSHEFPKLPPVLEELMENRSARFDPSVVSALIRAFSSMSTLSMFKWRFAHVKLSDVTDISRALLDGPARLHALSLDLPGFTDSNLPIWQLCSLVRVILYDPCESAEEMLIQRCPNLEDLSLNILVSRCFGIFKQGRWTKLRRLSLSGVLFWGMSAEEKETIMTDFFQRHSSLECLMSTVDLSSLRLPDSSLQMLRSISFGTQNPRTKLSSFPSGSVLANIVHYKANSYNFDCEAKMPNLETLQFTAYSQADIPNLRHFLQNAPNLRKTCLVAGTLSQMDIRRWAAFLASFSKVTHVYLFSSYLSGNVEKIIKQFSRIKTLRYMHVFIGNGIRREDPFYCAYEEIKRNSSGKYIGHDSIPYSKSKIGAPPSKWGDFFVEL